MRTALVVVIVAIASAVGCAMIGPGGDPATRVLALVGVWILAGWPPAAYLLGAIGWGLMLGRFVSRDHTPDRNALCGAVGIGLTLGITMLLGMAGLLTPLSAWVWTGIGLCGLVWSLRDRLPTPALDGGSAGSSIGWLVGAVGAGVMLAACSMPPGAQWDSEFGGYDSLSYHLQLQNEWILAGRISPSEHNVYSYLPSYIESAGVHMHMLANPISGAGTLTDGNADGVLSANILSMLLAAVGAWCVARIISTLLERLGIGFSARRAAGPLGGALVLLTPWVQAVGSMAYNETGVIALGSAGILASVAGGITPVRRGILVAFLIGSAAGCKPTAILFLAPACALLMAWSCPPRAWAPMFGIGFLVGLATLAPWLARNAAHGGNPVFPQAHTILGNAHWTEQQADLYKQGHSFVGSITDRISLLVLPDPGTTADSPTVARWRGLSNPQWAITPWAGMLACIVLCSLRRTRAIGVLIGAGIMLGLLAWLFATHLQSRFLVPMAPLFACAFGVAIGSVMDLQGSDKAERGVRKPMAQLGLLVLAVSAAWGIVNFAQQRGGRPNELLGLGPSVFTGGIDLGEATDSIPSAWSARAIPEGGVLLVGDAAPLYWRSPTTYATVWDRGPLSEAVRAEPNAPSAWTGRLVEDGHRYALVSFAELERLIQSGWCDPELTRERISAWTETLGEPIMMWPELGSALYQLDPTPRGTTP